MKPWPNRRVMVTGGGGFLGKAVVGRLMAAGVAKDDIFVPRSKDYDLRTAEGVGDAVRKDFERRVDAAEDAVGDHALDER